MLLAVLILAALTSGCSMAKIEATGFSPADVDETLADYVRAATRRTQPV